MILDNIVSDKKEYIDRAKSLHPLNEIKRLAKEASFDDRSLVESIRAIGRSASVAGGAGQRVPVIAEIKRRSPSGGEMGSAYDPIELASIYEKNSAVAISVLTDEKYFGGSADDLTMVRKMVSLPILRKDFIIDEYQVYEAKAFGADLILLIAAILDDGEMKRLLHLAHELGLEVLVESHTCDELERSIATGAILLGINNRNLDTLKTDLATSEELISMLPDGRIAVTESGVKSKDDVRRLLNAGANAFLIGESLLKDKDPGSKLAEMVYANVEE